MANDFMKWRIRTSFRLFGMPQRKNNTVTRMKGTRCPAGNSRDPARPSGLKAASRSLVSNVTDPSALGFISPLLTFRGRQPGGPLRRRPAVGIAAIHYSARESDFLYRRAKKKAGCRP